MGRLTRRRWVRHLDKLHAQFQKECQNRAAGQLSLPRMLGLESPTRTHSQRTRRTGPMTCRKVQTILRFTPAAKRVIAPALQGKEDCIHESGPNARGTQWPPAQRCAGERIFERRPPVQRCTGVSFNDQVSTIPPAAPRPVGLRSGGNNSVGPIARTGPTRHSGERILDVDTNT